MIGTEIFDELDAPVKLVSTLEAPMPYSKALEVVLLPSKERIMQAVRDVCA
jgi:pyruvate dehydrogenase E1 component beta subunit